MLKIVKSAEGIDASDVTYVAATEISSFRLSCSKLKDDQEPGSEALEGQAELALKNGNILSFDLSDEEDTIISCSSPDGDFRQIKTISDLENYLLSANVSR